MNNTIYTDANFNQFAKLFNPYGCNPQVFDAKGESTEFNQAIDINYSNILTRLIQEAGRYCEHYASDLFIDWSSIDRTLRDGSIESYSHLFGFREMGVDHNSFVFSRADNNHRNFDSEYRSLWRLDIEVEVIQNYWWHGDKKKVKMSLYRVHAPYFTNVDKFFSEIKEELKQKELSD